MAKQKIILHVFILALSITLFFPSLPYHTQEYVRISPPDSVLEADPSRNGDGSKIVWNIIRKGLYIINVDGTGKQTIFEESFYPWNPDGTKVVCSVWYPE